MAKCSQKPVDKGNVDWNQSRKHQQIKRSKDMNETK